MNKKPILAHNSWDPAIKKSYSPDSKWKLLASSFSDSIIKSLRRRTWNEIQTDISPGWSCSGFQYASTKMTRQKIITWYCWKSPYKLKTQNNSHSLPFTKIYLNNDNSDVIRFPFFHFFWNCKILLEDLKYPTNRKLS